MSSAAARPIRLIRADRRPPVPVRHAPFIAGELVLLAAIAALALAVKRHPGPLPGDVDVELGVQHALLPHRLLTDGVEAVSTLNWPVPATLTLAAIVLVFLLLRRWLDVLVVIVTAAVVEETSYLFNQYIHRPRPSGHGIHVLSTIQGSYSFPSGHVVYATAMFGLFLYLTTQVRRPLHPALIPIVRVVVLAALLLMPVSRVLEGEHWPTDVLAGLLYGGFWLAIAAHVYVWARARWPRLLARDER